MHGWPWSVAGPAKPERMEDGRPWPKISIITPNFNYGHYLEETIRSVLLQDYPNLEYIIIDGGSSDASLEIIKRYEPWLAYWESKPDRGQAHAINKGFEKATGDIVAWINSDDVYMPGALRAVACCYAGHPDQIILGDVEDFDDEAQRAEQKVLHDVTPKAMLRPLDDSWFWHQPGTFVPMAVQRKIGKIDETLNYAFDKDWIFRLLEVSEAYYLGEVVVRFRVHSAAKTSADMDAWIREIYLVNRRYLHLLPHRQRAAMRASYHLRLAGLYLVEHQGYAPFFSRWRGARELVAALATSLSTVRQAKFLSLTRRLLLPRALWRSGH